MGWWRRGQGERPEGPIQIAVRNGWHELLEWILRIGGGEDLLVISPPQEAGNGDDDNSDVLTNDQDCCVASNRDRVGGYIKHLGIGNCEILTRLPCIEGAFEMREAW